MKRRRTDENDEEEDVVTPKRPRPQAHLKPPPDDTNGLRTPSKRIATPLRSALKNTPTKANGLLNGLNGHVNGIETPKSQRKVVFVNTPSKPQDESPIEDQVTPTVYRGADRSARRKANRKLLERTINGEASDEDGEEEDILAQQIWEADEAVPDDGSLEPLEDSAPQPETPSKRGRGRPKGSKNRVLSPPRDLPPHELYFFQNRAGGAKTSNNTLPSSALLKHDTYFAAINGYEEPHKPQKDFLHELHSRSFDQWAFELKCGFNICLYGYGSKRKLAMDFAEHMYQGSEASERPRIIVINGYNTSLTVRDLYHPLCSALFPKFPVLKPSTSPQTLVGMIHSHLDMRPPSTPALVIVHSIDAAPLRRSATQSFLASLGTSPHIRILATADTPNFPLLWDLSLKSQYDFLFHDCTTFAPYEAEVDVVESVNELLQRSGRRIGGRDGVGYVLKSLPENARNLFRVLVAEQLAIMTDDIGDPASAERTDMDMDMDGDRTPGRRSAVDASQSTGVGVEYRSLYQKAVEEFICSSEMAFRTLLKEFHDHQMIESRKDAFGTETLFVPFRREELEGLLEDLVG